MANIYTDFTKRDFSANFERLLALLSTEVPELSDRNHSDGGISLARLQARQTDMLSFYIDEAFSEGYVETAKFKQSLIELGTLVDCRPKLASPAVTTLKLDRIELGFGESYVDIPIPANSIFTRFDDVPYLNLDPLLITTDIVTETFDVIQLKRVVKTLTKHDFDYFGPYPRLMYNLGRNVVSGFVTLYDVAGEWYWVEVDSFYRSMPTDRHFALELFADDYNGEQDTVFITIGDGLYGSNDLPHNMILTYYQTEGSTGNGGTGIVTSIPSAFRDLFTITNTTGCTGGAEAESTERFRQRLPKVVQTQRRGVTETDYDAQIQSVPGVLHCQTVSRSSDVNWPYMYVVIYVLPEGGGTMSAYLRNLVSEKCKLWGHLGDWTNRYVLLDAIENVLDVSLNIGKTAGYQQLAVDTAVRAALTTFFDPSNILIGTNISFTDLNRTISNIPGVDWVEFISPSNTIIVPAGNTYTLGRVSITHGQ